MVTEMGYGKRTSVEEYRLQSRGGVGVITQKTTDKVGNMVCTSLLNDKHEVIITTNKGQVIRTRSGEISLLGRNTQGVRLININKDELVTGVAIVLDEETAAAQVVESLNENSVTKGIKTESMSNNKDPNGNDEIN
jgi:DNA gyrase subunit A